MKLETAPYKATDKIMELCGGIAGKGIRRGAYAFIFLVKHSVVQRYPRS